MDDVLAIQKQLIPDLLEEMKSRVTLLQHISHFQPIGRRTLAQAVGTTERILRAQVEFLKAQGLVVIESNGISISRAGSTLLERIEPVMSSMFNMEDLARALEKSLTSPMSLSFRVMPIFHQRS